MGIFFVDRYGFGMGIPSGFGPVAIPTGDCKAVMYIFYGVHLGSNLLPPTPLKGRKHQGLEVRQLENGEIRERGSRSR